MYNIGGQKGLGKPGKSYVYFFQAQSQSSEKQFSRNPVDETVQTRFTPRIAEDC